MTDDGRIVPYEELLDLLAWYRLSAIDHQGEYLFCRHALHRAAPCSECRLERERGER